MCSRDHLTRVINCYICVTVQLPNRGSLFERPLLENCDRERVWNPNRVQFLDVWTELRGSTGICWFATLQSYDCRDSWQNVCINLNLLLHWSVVSSTCDQTGSLWAVPSLLAVSKLSETHRGGGEIILKYLTWGFQSFSLNSCSAPDYIANLCSVIYILFL